jgi:hypothetical protein
MNNHLHNTINVNPHIYGTTVSRTRYTDRFLWLMYIVDIIFVNCAVYL